MNKVNYSKELEKKIEQFQKEGRYPKLLLHACCAPCSSYCLEYLRQYFDITVFFYNPNIMNEPEYVKRVEEEKRLIAEYNRQVETGNFEGMNSDKKARRIEIIEGKHNVSDFLTVIKGLESCPEGGDRCTKCFELRLEESAKIAKTNRFEFFTTRLMLSSDSIYCLKQSLIKHRIRSSSIVGKGYKRRNMDCYMTIADELLRYSKAPIIHKYLRYTLSKVFYTGHQIPYKDKPAVFWRALKSGYLKYIGLKSSVKFFT